MSHRQHWEKLLSLPYLGQCPPASNFGLQSCQPAGELLGAASSLNTIAAGQPARLMPRKPRAAFLALLFSHLIYGSRVMTLLRPTVGSESSFLNRFAFRGLMSATGVRSFAGF